MGSWFFSEFYPPEYDDTLTSEKHNDDHEQIEQQSIGNESVKTAEPNRSRMQLYPPINEGLSDTSTCNTDREYSASVASSGSGFHGETAILGKTLDDDSGLPSDSNQIIDSIQRYLLNVTLDQNIMNSLIITDKKFMNHVWDTKLRDTLTDLITNNKMSINAYDMLRGIFDALESHNYDTAKKKITQITKNTKEFKQNKKWIVTFKSIVRIAKQHNI